MKLAQRPRNRSCTHREEMHALSQIGKHRLISGSEPLLFIDDDKAQVCKI